MIWKELKSKRYKNYGYRILGVYSNDFYMEIGDTTYTESIETKVEIMNPLGDIIKEINWFDKEGGHYMLHNHPYEYLIQFTPVYDKKWFGKVLIDVIHIEDKYHQVIDKWENYCENYIDENISSNDNEVYCQEMTDGLPNNLFMKYAE